MVTDTKSRGPYLDVHVFAKSTTDPRDQWFDGQRVPARIYGTSQYMFHEGGMIYRRNGDGHIFMVGHCQSHLYLN